MASPPCPPGALCVHSHVLKILALEGSQQGRRARPGGDAGVDSPAVKGSGSSTHYCTTTVECIRHRPPTALPKGAPLVSETGRSSHDCGDGCIAPQGRRLPERPRSRPAVAASRLRPQPGSDKASDRSRSGRYCRPEPNKDGPPRTGLRVPRPTPDGSRGARPRPALPGPNGGRPLRRAKGSGANCRTANHPTQPESRPGVRPVTSVP